MTRTLLLVAVLAAAGDIGPTDKPVGSPDLAGVYHCSGTNPDGSAYEGVVEIAKLGGTFRVRWTMDDGSVLGVGIFSAGVFAVSYFGGAPAVVVYRMDGENLVGEWTIGGADGQTYSETLRKLGPATEPAGPATPLGPAPRSAPSGMQI
jgi:hypothetical protein